MTRTDGAASTGEAQDQQLVEAFAQAAVRGVGQDAILVMLRPWSSGPPPAGVLAPASREEPTLDREEIAALQNRNLVLVPCTFKDPVEQQAAERILPQFSESEAVCVFMALLLPPGTELDQAANDSIMARYSAMLALGVDEVLVDPSPEEAELRRVIDLSRSVWELNVRRMQLMLETEPEPVTQEELTQLQTQHTQLLWESIPRALMLHFNPLNRNLVETTHGLDRYRLLSRFQTVQGTVFLALDDHQAPRAIKVIDKSKVSMPGEVEGIYREFRFLSEIIRHPNVARCVEMLHSQTRVYLVFELAGNTNLAHILVSRPGQRLEEKQALHCFQQVVSGLAHCHSKDVAHRRVSLAHVAVSMMPDEQEQMKCVLVDFYNAMVARGESTSLTVCGSLPFIAPEMALGRAYVPRKADCWSLGILLLEMAGGLGTLSCCLQYNETGHEVAAVANSALEYFQAPGSQASALATIGAVDSAGVIARLGMLLKPEPPNRLPLAEVAALGTAEPVATPPEEPLDVF